MKRPAWSRRLSSNEMSCALMFMGPCSEAKAGFEVLKSDINIPRTRPTIKRSLSWGSHDGSHKGYGSYYHKKSQARSLDAKTSKHIHLERETTATGERHNDAKDKLRRSPSTDRTTATRRKPTRTKSISDLTTTTTTTENNDKPLQMRAKVSSTGRRNTLRRTKSSEYVFERRDKETKKLPPRRTKTAPSLKRTKSSKSIQAEQRSSGGHPVQKKRSQRKLTEETTRRTNLKRTDSSGMIKVRRRVSVSSRQSRQLEDRKDQETTDKIVLRKSKSPTRYLQRTASGNSTRIPKDTYDRNRHIDLGKSGSVRWERRHHQENSPRRKVRRSKSLRMIPVVSSGSHHSEEKAKDCSRENWQGSLDLKKHRSLHNLHVPTIVRQLERYYKQEASIWNRRAGEYERIDSMTDESHKNATESKRKKREEWKEDSQRFNSSNSSHFSVGVPNGTHDDLEDSISVLTFDN